MVIVTSYVDLVLFYCYDYLWLLFMFTTIRVEPLIKDGLF